MDLSELRKIRKKSVEEDPSGVVFVSRKKDEDKVEFPLSRAEIRAYSAFNIALEGEEENTIDWSEKKLREEPHSIAVIELNLSNNVIAAVVMFIHKYHPILAKERESKEEKEKKKEEKESKEESKEEKKEPKEEKEESKEDKKEEKKEEKDESKEQSINDVYQFFLKYQEIMSPVLDSLWKDGFYGIGSALLTAFQFYIDPLFDYLMGYIFFLCEGVPTSRLPDVINWDAKKEDRSTIEKIKFAPIDCDESEDEPFAAESIHFGDYSTKENIIASKAKEKRYAEISKKIALHTAKNGSPKKEESLPKKESISSADDDKNSEESPFANTISFLDKIHAIEYITKMVSQPKTSYLITTSGRFYISNYQFQSDTVFTNCETSAESGRIEKNIVRNVMIKDGVFKLIDEEADMRREWESKAINDSKTIEESKINDQSPTDAESPSFKIMIAETSLSVENNDKFYIYGMIYPSTEERKLSDIEKDENESLYYFNRYSRSIEPDKYFFHGLKFANEDILDKITRRNLLLAQLLLENQSLPREIINSYIVKLHEVNIPYLNFIIQRRIPIMEIFSSYVSWKVHYNKIKSCKNILIVPVTVSKEELFTSRHDDEDDTYNTVYHLYLLFINLYTMKVIEQRLIYEDDVHALDDSYFIEIINDDTYATGVKNYSNYDFIIEKVNIWENESIGRIIIKAYDMDYLGISSNEEIIFYDTTKNIFKFYSHKTGVMMRELSVNTLIDFEPTVQMINKNFAQIRLRSKEIYVDLIHNNSYIFAHSNYAIMNDKKLYIISTDLLALTATKEKTEVKVISREAKNNTRRSGSSGTGRRPMYEYILENGFLNEYMGLYSSTPKYLNIDTGDIKFNGPLAIYRVYDDNTIYIKLFDDRTKESIIINRFEQQRMALLDHDFISEDQVYMTDKTKIYVYDYSKRTIVSRDFGGVVPTIIPNRYMFFRQNRREVIQYTPCNKKFVTVINEDENFNYIPLTCSKLLEYGDDVVNILC